MILLIDTHSTKNFGIGIIDPGLHGGDFDLIYESYGEDAATELLEKIENTGKFEFINRIITICGPGSLTGLRIGSSFAQGLQIGKGISVFGIYLWDLFFSEWPDIEVFFYTGTKKWIYKTAFEQKILEFDEIEGSKNIWLSNKPEKLLIKLGGNYIEYPNIIKMMSKWHAKAKKDLPLIYPVTLF